jgi:hypothetical protein
VAAQKVVNAREWEDWEQRVTGGMVSSLEGKARVEREDRDAAMQDTLLLVAAGAVLLLGIVAVVHYS